MSTYTDSVLSLIEKCSEQRLYGALFIGLPSLNYRELLPQLGEHVHVSVVGAADPEVAAWAVEEGYGSDRFGMDSDATHAVELRNMALSPNALRVVVAPQDVERLHSLTTRGYESFGQDELVGHVLRLGAQKAPNDPQQNLWEVLLLDDIRGRLTLGEVVDYYEHVYSEEADIQASPKAELHRLGFFTDSDLLTGGNTTKERIERRLLENLELIEKMKRGSDEDLQRAFENQREDNSLTRAYSALLGSQRRDYSAMVGLSFDEVQRLFSRNKPKTQEPEGEGDDTSGGGDGAAVSDGPVKYDSFVEAAVDNLFDGDIEHVDSLLEKAALVLGKDRVKREELKSSKVVTTIMPDVRALAFTSTLLGSQRYGGVLDVAEPAAAVLDSVTPGRFIDEFVVYDEVWLADTSHYLEVAEEELEGFEGHSLLETYLERRQRLFNLYNEELDDSLRIIDMLTHPDLALTCFAAKPELRELAREAIDAYQRLISHLDISYSQISELSPKGAQIIYGHILSLDMITIRGSDEVIALLSPANPLVLWKYWELSRLVGEGNAGFSEADKALLKSEVTSVPEPLLALHVPGTIDHDPAELVYTSRIGTMPVYQPSTIEGTDVDAASLERACRKLAALYPPARVDLKLMLLNPRSLAAVEKVVTRLLNDTKNPVERINVLIARTKDRHDLTEVRTTDKLDEFHARGRVRLEEVNFSDIDAVGEHLKAYPVHIVSASGEKQKNTSTVVKEGTRLHPLCIPKRLEADVLTKDVSLQPRSNRPEDDDPHPYALYYDLVGALTQKTRRDRSLRESWKASLDDFRPLFEHTIFLVIAGGTLKRERGEDALCLSQGSGLYGDVVFTHYGERVVRSVTQLLKEANLIPDEDKVEDLLRKIEQIGGEGLFKAISPTSKDGFSAQELKGQVGLAVALAWYKENTADADEQLILSLDTTTAARWMGKREDGKRTDLLGIRERGGEITVDVIEVKGFSHTEEQWESNPHAGMQLRAMGKLINELLVEDSTGSFLSDRRRELLRFQVYREGLLRTKAKKPWVDRLNSLIDGQVEDVTVNLMLIEIDFEGKQAAIDEEVTLKVDGEDLSLRRVRLDERVVQHHLHGIQAPLELTDPTEASDGDVPPPPPNGDETPQVAASEQGEDSPQVIEEPTGTASVSVGPSEVEYEKIYDTTREIYRAFENYGISISGEIDPDEADIGPNIVRYKIRLAPGEKVSKLESIRADLMRELAVEKEPMVGNLPGTKFVYIDLPRPERQTASLGPVLEAAAGDLDRQPYSVPAGVAPNGEVHWLDIMDLPHMLVAGQTKSGKSMFLYSLISSLAFLHPPNELRLILVDPKKTDFVWFGELPHLHGREVITEAAEAVEMLERLLEVELEQRTDQLVAAKMQNIHQYNAANPGEPMPPIFVVIDEFADLVDTMDRKRRDEFDSAVKRLAQRARSAGIHLILATQRPTTDIVNGTIKANMPCRVSFRLGSMIDSRTILDSGGAEALLGKGDMLLSFEGRLERLQGLFMSNDDIADLVSILND